MATAILGIGTALPVQVTQAQTMEHALTFSCRGPKDEKVLEQIYRRTGIKSRSSVLAPVERARTFYKPRSISDDHGPTTSRRMHSYAMEAPALALESSRLALQHAHIQAAEITHLITVTCTGFFAPGFDISLIQGLPLPESTLRTQVGFMGCHAAINALRTADAICTSNPDARVLLCATEVCSLHFQYGWDANSVIANALFADGAAALVLGWTGQGSQLDGATVRSTLIGEASKIIAGSTDYMTWNIGDNGFRMTLSSAVPDAIEEHLPSWLLNWLNEHSMTVQDVPNWIVHPGGPRILDSVQSALNLSAEQMQPSRSIFEECGNMSSPTVLFILQRLLSQGKRGPCVMLGFGPGLAFEGALLNI